MKRNTLGILALLCLVIMAFTSCTENERVKSFGGSFTVNLPKGQKLVNATWKDTDLWYLTKPMSSKDSCETYTFKEGSTYGIFEGTVTFIESK